MMLSHELNIAIERHHWLSVQAWLESQYVTYVDVVVFVIIDSDPTSGKTSAQRLSSLRIETSEQHTQTRYLLELRQSTNETSIYIGC
jgi:hypothetical protein